jgi:hypothetical protein
MASRVDTVNQTDLVSEVDSRSAEGAAAMDFGVDMVDMVDTVDLGVAAMEMEVTRTRGRPKEEQYRGTLLNLWATRTLWDFNRPMKSVPGAMVGLSME